MAAVLSTVRDVDALLDELAILPGWRVVTTSKKGTVYAPGTLPPVTVWRKGNTDPNRSARIYSELKKRGWETPGVPKRAKEKTISKPHPTKTPCITPQVESVPLRPRLTYPPILRIDPREWNASRHTVKRIAEAGIHIGEALACIDRPERAIWGKGPGQTSPAWTATRGDVQVVYNHQPNRIITVSDVNVDGHPDTPTTREPQLPPPGFMPYDITITDLPAALAALTQEDNPMPKPVYTSRIPARADRPFHSTGMSLWEEFTATANDGTGLKPGDEVLRNDWMRYGAQYQVDKGNLTQFTFRTTFTKLIANRVLVYSGTEGVYNVFAGPVQIRQTPSPTVVAQRSAPSALFIAPATPTTEGTTKTMSGSTTTRPRDVLPEPKIIIRTRYKYARDFVEAYIDRHGETPFEMKQLRATLAEYNANVSPEPTEGAVCQMPPMMVKAGELKRLQVGRYQAVRGKTPKPTVPAAGPEAVVPQQAAPVEAKAGAPVEPAAPAVVELEVPEFAAPVQPDPVEVEWLDTLPGDEPKQRTIEDIVLDLFTHPDVGALEGLLKENGQWASVRGHIDLGDDGNTEITLRRNADGTYVFAVKHINTA